MGLRRRIWNAARVLAGRSPVGPPTPPPLADGHLLAGRRALVTGSGRNIGKAIAFEMARQGARIVLNDRCPDALREAAREARESGLDATAVLADISDPASVDALMAEVQATGGCDILVNNAATLLPHDHPEPLDDDLWRRIYETNVFGPVRLTRLWAAQLVQRGAPGVALFISSTHARVTFGAPSYSTSKAAIEHLVQELAVSLAPHGIRVNGIAPGYVAPDSAGGPLPHDIGLLYHSTVPASFVGRAAVVLACETLSAHTTGTTLVVDSGVSALSYLTAAVQGARAEGRVTPTEDYPSEQGRCFEVRR
ncbi:MAG TPA: SDR family oxidoreductase [Gemmatimonadales bacterium]|nr:SDR family oxidoreductase [Gemmatimonadales bacterium]